MDCTTLLTIHTTPMIKNKTHNNPPLWGREGVGPHAASRSVKAIYNKVSLHDYSIMVEMPSEELLEDWERTQFGEGGHVEAVVGEDDLGEAVTLVAREAEQVHGVKGHTHKGNHKRRVGSAKEIGVQGWKRREAAGLEVEESAWYIAF